MNPALIILIVLSAVISADFANLTNNHPELPHNYTENDVDTSPSTKQYLFEIASTEFGSNGTTEFEIGLLELDKLDKCGATSAMNLAALCQAALVDTLAAHVRHFMLHIFTLACCCRRGLNLCLAAAFKSSGCNGEEESLVDAIEIIRRSSATVLAPIAEETCPQDVGQGLNRGCTEFLYPFMVTIKLIESLKNDTSNVTREEAESKLEYPGGESLLSDGEDGPSGLEKMVHEVKKQFEDSDDEDFAPTTEIYFNLTRNVSEDTLRRGKAMRFLRKVSRYLENRIWHFPMGSTNNHKTIGNATDSNPDLDNEADHYFANETGELPADLVDFFHVKPESLSNNGTELECTSISSEQFEVSSTQNSSRNHVAGFNPIVTPSVRKEPRFLSEKSTENAEQVVSTEGEVSTEYTTYSTDSTGLYSTGSTGIYSTGEAYDTRIYPTEEDHNTGIYSTIGTYNESETSDYPDIFSSTPPTFQNDLRQSRSLNIDENSTDVQNHVPSNSFTTTETNSTVSTSIDTTTDDAFVDPNNTLKSGPTKPLTDYESNNKSHAVEHRSARAGEPTPASGDIAGNFNNVFNAFVSPASSSPTPLIFPPLPAIPNPFSPASTSASFTPTSNITNTTSNVTTTVKNNATTANGPLTPGFTLPPNDLDSDLMKAIKILNSGCRGKFYFEVTPILAPIFTFLVNRLIF